MKMDNTAQIMAAMRIAELPRKKSMALAVILALIFGWIGALYANWRWALAGVAATIVASVVFIDAGPNAQAAITILSWCASLYVSYTGVREHNEIIHEKRR